jgi:peptide/nickel transport system permease protein
MANHTNDTEPTARRPIRHVSNNGRSSRMVLMAIILVGIFFVSIMAVPSPTQTVHAKTMDTAQANVAIVNNTYAIVAYGETKALDSGDILLARTPEGVKSTRGWVFTWTIGDGGEVTDKSAIYTWNHIGEWNVLLTVVTLEGEIGTDNMTVRVVPNADGGPSRNIRVNDYQNLTVTLNANGSASEWPIATYEWSFRYGGHDYTESGYSMTFNFSKAGRYQIQIKVTDEMGNVGYDNVTVHIKRLPYFYEDHWVLVFIVTPLLIIAALWVLFKYRRDKALITATDKEKARLQMKNFKETWRIFKANRLGFAGLIILVIFVLMAIFAPYISTVPEPNKQGNLEDNIPSKGWLNPLPPSFSPSPYTNWTHPFGTDHKGQDVYSSTMYGARASLEVGMAATLISVIVGAVMGLAAGYFGKLTDEILMRTTDFFLVIPWFPLMIVMMAILGQKFIWVVVVIGITSWPSTARIVRSQVLTVKERQFIVRSRCVGAPDSHILRTHIMPNVLPLIFANTVLLVAIAIFNEAFLDFFGLGDPTVISWGTMLEAAYENNAFVSGAWWWIIAPGAAIVIIVLAFSLVGYAIDDVLNPKLRRR